MQQRDLKIDELHTDLQDGVKLHTLLEILGNEEVLPKTNRRAKLKLQKVENLNTCLRYIKAKNINLVNIGAEGALLALSPCWAFPLVGPAGFWGLRVGTRPVPSWALFAH